MSGEWQVGRTVSYVLSTESQHRLQTEVIEPLMPQLDLRCVVSGQQQSGSRSRRQPEAEQRLTRE